MQRTARTRGCDPSRCAAAACLQATKHAWQQVDAEVERRVVRLAARLDRERTVQHLRARPDRDGDASARRGVAQDVLDARRATQDKAGWKPAEVRPRKITTALRAYASMTTSAARGAVRYIPED